MLKRFENEFKTKDVRIRLRNSEHTASLLVGRFGVCKKAYIQDVGFVPVKTIRTIFGIHIINLKEIQRLVDGVSKSQNIKDHLIAINTTRNSKNTIDLGNDTLYYFTCCDEKGKPGEAQIDTTYNLDESIVKGLVDPVKYVDLFADGVIEPEWADSKPGAEKRSFSLVCIENDVRFTFKGTVSVPEKYRAEHTRQDALFFPVDSASIHAVCPRLYFPKETRKKDFEQTMQDAGNVCRNETEGLFNMSFFISEAHKRAKEAKKEREKKEREAKKEKRRSSRKTEIRK